MKDAYYFSHDVNARRDPKILALRSEYGNEGYGNYWIIVEMLAEQSDYKLKYTKWVINAISMEINLDPEQTEKFIESLINDYELLVTDNEYFWSESLLRRMSIKDEKRQKRAEAAKKGAEAKWKKYNEEQSHVESNNNVEQTHSNSIAYAEQEQCLSNAIYAKVKESKVKESKVKVDTPTLTPKKNKYGEFQKVCLSDEEYLKLNEKLGQLMAEDLITRLDSYKASTGKNYKSDYATILNWSRKEPININKPNQSKQYSNPFLELLKEELDKEANPFE